MAINHSRALLDILMKVDSFGTALTCREPRVFVEICRSHYKPPPEKSDVSLLQNLDDPHASDLSSGLGRRELSRLRRKRRRQRIMAFPRASSHRQVAQCGAVDG